MQKSLAELSQTRVKKLEDNVFRKVCEVFGFDRLNKHQEEALRFVFEFWAVLVSESRLVSVAWWSTIGL